MPLSGNLGFVPLGDVLRLVSRTRQKVSVEVRGPDVRGRVFFVKDGIVLATVIDDGDLRQLLVNSNLVDDAYLRQVESGEADFRALTDKPERLVDTLREITVESLYQMTENGSSFEVKKESVTPYGAAEAFEVEGLMDDVNNRADEWIEVASVVSDIEGVITMRGDLGDREEVTISRDAWKMLSELGTGASVSDMASRLGTTPFRASRMAVELATKGLLLLDDHLPVEEPAHPEDEDSLPTEEGLAADVEANEASDDSKTSWWEDSKAEDSEEDGADFVSDADGDAEEDAEIFLEKVFSELSSEESADEGQRIGSRGRFGSVLDDQPDTD